MADQHDLSEREIEILKLVATGASNKEIAKTLYISPNTVKVHLKNIFAKIGVLSRTEAAMYAVRNGLVPAASLTFEVEGSPTGDAGRMTLENRDISSQKVYWLLGLSFILFLIGLGLVLASRSGFVSQANIPLPTPTEIPRWQRRADMPTARFGLAAAVFDNKIYAIGGETENGVTGVVERYDPATDTWERLADKPTPVADVGAVVIGGKIYVPGGRLEDGKTTDVMEMFDPVTNRWEEGEKLPIKVSAYAIAAFEGRMYLFGGWDGEILNRYVILYSPEKDAWIIEDSLNVPRIFCKATISGGKIYLMGGFDGKNMLKLNEIYSPNNDTGGGSAWITIEPIPVAIDGIGVTNVTDVIFVFSGSNNGLSNSFFFSYFPQSKQWNESQNAAINFGIKSGIISSDTFVYIIGGISGNKILNNNISYQAVYRLLFPFSVR